ncbi:MAG: RpiB/LacA/LacB family sugar-phosphate isomerase, partial [Patescibacteria group bacterium]
KEVAQTSRTDDNSNILCLPGHHMELDEAKEIVHTWLNTNFAGEDRHNRRLKKIEQIENQEFCDHQD